MPDPHENLPVIDLTHLWNTADDVTANVIAVDGGWIVESTENETRNRTRTANRAPRLRSTRQGSRARTPSRPSAANSARAPAANSVRAPADNSVRLPAANSAQPPADRSAHGISPSSHVINPETTERVNNASPDVIISSSPLSRSHPETTEHVNIPDPSERTMYPKPHILNPEPIVIADSPQVPTVQRKVARNLRKTSREVAQTDEEQFRERSPLGGNFGLRPLCPICLEHIGSQQLVSTKCGHVFCQKCLTLALGREKKCPTCRKKLRGNSAYHPLFLHID